MGEIGSEYKELEYGVDGFDYFELKKKISVCYYLDKEKCHLFEDNSKQRTRGF